MKFLLVIGSGDPINYADLDNNLYDKYFLLDLQAHDMNTPQLRETFLVFREQCIWLQTCFDMYAVLYESDEDTTRVMLATAPLFFHDLNSILIEYCRLQVCRLTDPKRSRNRDNLTVEHINELLEAENKLTPEILVIAEALAGYRSLVQDSRNWIISHADKHTLLTGLSIGEHSQEDVSAFFENLYRYVDVVGDAVGVGPLDFRSTSGAGDALDLLRYLKAALIPPSSG